MASLSKSKNKKFNCTSSIIDWVKPDKALHALLSKNSIETFDAPGYLFKNVATAKKINSVLLPQILGGVESEVTLMSLLKDEKKASHIKFEMYSPSTLLKSVNWDDFFKLKFDYQGYKGHAVLI